VIHTPGIPRATASSTRHSRTRCSSETPINNLDLVTGQPGAHLAPQAANTSTNQAYESLSRIEELDAQTLYFGHGDPSTQGTAQSSPRPAPQR